METVEAKSGPFERRFSSASSEQYAPWYTIPTKPIVSIEHPYMIKNIDRGIASLGGSEKLKKLVEESADAKANLYLRPGNRMTKPLQSTNVKTNNLLLEITVPKRTGLKRRRGAEGPYYESIDDQGLSSSDGRPSKPVSLTGDAHYLLRSLRDNPLRYQVEGIGVICQTHRFRGIPDFVTSTANSPFMKKMKEHILPFDYDKMKGFKFDLSKGIKPNIEIIPPPRWSQLEIPFNYSYHQNPSVKQVVDDLGNVSIVNLQAPPKAQNQPVPFDIPTVPAGPAPDLQPLKTLEPAMQRLVAGARRIMEDRPIFTRRSLPNCIPGDDWEAVGLNTAKYVYQYVGYIFASGPWRDAIVKFGVDPRKDPKYRIYQTMMFMLDTEPKDSRAKYSRSKPKREKTEQELRKESHLFDGKHVSKDGKVWQVCDITDPVLQSLLATPNVRQKCQIQSDGWYHNGTWAAAKILMKAKIAAILDGVPPNDALYTKLASELPSIIFKNYKPAAQLSKPVTPEEVHLASTIRSTAVAYGNSKADDADGGNAGEEEESDGEMPNPENLDPRLVDSRVTEAVNAFDALEGGRTTEMKGNARTHGEDPNAAMGRENE